MKQADRGRRGGGDLLAASRISLPDHPRERAICAVIDGMATDASLDSQVAPTLLRFLNEEWNVPMHDDANDLFPLLPIVRLRVTQRDLPSLSRRMRTRRGQPPTPETADA